MSTSITIRPAGGTWVVRAGGAVLGESSKALELNEGTHQPVIYFPRGDIAMEFLDESTQKTSCPHKGTASYYSIVTKSRTLENSVWSYEEPRAEVADIKGYLAFYTSDFVTVEQV